MQSARSSQRLAWCCGEIGCIKLTKPVSSTSDLPPDFYGFMSVGWAVPHILYLKHRHQPIVSRFLNTMRYVELADSNALAYSYEYGSILRDASSLFGPFSYAMCTDAVKACAWRSSRSTKHIQVGDYHECYFQHCSPNWTRWHIDVTHLLPKGRLQPLDDWGPKRGPTWWRAYNDVKHSEYKKMSQGNLLHSISRDGGNRDNLARNIPAPFRP